VLAGAASRIEHSSNQVPRRSHTGEGWLGSPDVPCRWFLRRIDGIEVVTWSLHGKPCCQE
jgi:hypothetical protein